jgi:hypothetical protein
MGDRHGVLINDERSAIKASPCGMLKLTATPERANRHRSSIDTTRILVLSQASSMIELGFNPTSCTWPKAVNVLSLNEPSGYQNGCTVG